MLASQRLSRKIILGFLVIASFCLLTSVVGLRAIRSGAVRSQEMYEKMTVPLSQLMTASVRFQLVRAHAGDLLFAQNFSAVDQANAKLQGLFASIRALDADFRKTFVSDEDRKNWEAFLAAVAAFEQQIPQFAGLAQLGRRDEAYAFSRSDLTPRAEAIQAQLDKMAELSLTQAKGSKEAIEREASVYALEFGGVTLLCLVLAVVIGLWLSSRIARPVQKVAEAAAQLAQVGSIPDRLELTSHDEVGNLALAFNMLLERMELKAREAEAIAQGDLTLEVEVASEEDRLGQAFRKMSRQLQGLVREIRDAAAGVAAGSREISSASQSLSQGDSEQASSLEEISASATEIGSQARANAENAGKANALIASARTSAEKGDQQMKSMVSAMQQITSSSQQIAKVIKIIDDIAFQTNLLALNAAVEAARAGKHGKGFAVVAEEVRSLAGRSAKAARETAEMIEASTKSVENGLNVAAATSQSFGRIVGDVVKTADLIGEMFAASNEQAEGISQISLGLNQIDRVTQQNTASAEQTSSSAVELSSGAGRVTDLVNRFRLANDAIATDGAGDGDTAAIPDDWADRAGSEHHA